MKIIASALGVNSDWLETGHGRMELAGRVPTFKNGNSDRGSMIPEICAGYGGQKRHRLTVISSDCATIDAVNDSGVPWAYAGDRVMDNTCVAADTDDVVAIVVGEEFFLKRHCGKFNNQIILMPLQGTGKSLLLNVSELPMAPLVAIGVIHNQCPSLDNVAG